MSDWKIETRAVQSGYSPKDGEPRIVPITQSTTFRYDNTQSVADLFDLAREGFFYSRLANPTVDALEKKIAALEGGVAAVALSSGQAANTFAIMNAASAGSHIVAASCLYGGTISLFTNTLKKMGVEVTLVNPDLSLDELQKAIRPNTRVVFGEMLSNPSMDVLDIEKFATLAHGNGVPLIVDNTFPTPFFCNPFDLGADIVTHSTTKYLDGHACSLGGVIVEAGKFNWSNGKFPEFTEPDASYHGLIYTKAFAACPYSVKLRVQWVRDVGMSQTPFNAFLTMLGTETLHLRMERHAANALKLAQFLQTHNKVSWIKYPGLKDDSQYEKAQKYLRGTSGVFSFGIKGGKAAGAQFIDSLKLAALVVHVADVRSCVLHPASMTHRQLSDAELIAAGVSPDLIRVSVGIENIDDLIADFQQALNQVK